MPYFPKDPVYRKVTTRIDYDSFVKQMLKTEKKIEQILDFRLLYHFNKIKMF